MEIVSILKGFFRKNSKIYILLFGFYGSVFLVLFLNEEFGFPLITSKNFWIKTVSTLVLYGILMLTFYLHLPKSRKIRFRKAKIIGFFCVFWISLIVLHLSNFPYERFLSYLPREWIFWSWRVVKQLTHTLPLLVFPLLYDFYRYKTNPVPFEKRKPFLLSYFDSGIDHFWDWFFYSWLQRVLSKGPDYRRTAFISCDLDYNSRF